MSHTDSINLSKFAGSPEGRAYSIIGPHEARLSAIQQIKRILKVDPVDTVESDASTFSSPDDIREFLRSSARKPSRGRILAVLHNIDSLDARVSTILLKTIEEPPAKSVILLSHSSKSSTLRTVISRTTHILVGRSDFSKISQNCPSAQREDAETAADEYDSLNQENLKEALSIAEAKHIAENIQHLATSYRPEIIRWLKLKSIGILPSALNTLISLHISDNSKHARRKW